MTPLAILLYLAVGYFLDRYIESDYENGQPDGEVMFMRYAMQFAWPLLPVWVVVLIVLYVRRSAKRRAAARSTEGAS